jgi:pimeloyl-ACP methyl ester carboxylesterase
MTSAAVFPYPFLSLYEGLATLDHWEPSGRPVLLMIRGLSRSFNSWLGLHERLSYYVDVLCMDLPGVGLAAEEPLAETVEAMADRLARTLQGLSLPPIYILAPSLGAMVAMELSLRIPVAGLFLMAPSHTGVGLNRLTQAALLSFARALVVRPEARVQLSKRLLVAHQQGRAAFASQADERLWEITLLQDSQDLGPRGQWAQIQAALRYTSRRALQHIRSQQIPTWVLIPHQDCLIPVPHAYQVYAALHHAQSAAIPLPGAGHDIVTTHGAEVEALALRFIQGHFAPDNRVPQPPRPRHRGAYVLGLGLLALWLYRRGQR